MIKHEFGMAHAEVSEEEGTRAAAAEEYWKEGQKMCTIDSLLKDESNLELTKKAKNYILLILWGNISFAARDWPNDSNTPLSDVAGLTDELLQKSNTALPHED